MRVEPRIYTLPTRDFYTPNGKDHRQLTDAEFIELAEQQGTVSTLSGFQELFNHQLEDISNQYTCIRILWVKISDNGYGVVVSNYHHSERQIDEVNIF